MAFCPKRLQKKFLPQVSNAPTQHDRPRFPDTKFTSKSHLRRTGGRQEATKRNYTCPMYNDKIDEKTFIYKVGGRMTWKRFIAAKNYIKLFDGVMEWDDDAAEEAFFAARARFLSEEMGFLHHGYDIPPLNPDMHIDNVDLNNDDQQVGNEENDPFLCISDAEGDDDERYEVMNGRKILIPESYFIPLDEDCLVPPNLTGMIVGGSRS